VEESLKWIDFFGGGIIIDEAGKAEEKADMRKLIQSDFSEGCDLSAPDVGSFMSAYTVIR